MCKVCGCGMPAAKTRTVANDTSKVNSNHKFSAAAPSAAKKIKVSKFDKQNPNSVKGL